MYFLNPTIFQTAAHENQWPWVAQIKVKNKLICGGVLIAPYWVLTAAHCGIKMHMKMMNMTAQTNDWSIILGETSQYTSSKPYKIDFVVLNSFTNYDYDMPRKDIALLRLNEKIPYQTANIRFACLPELQATGPPPENKKLYNDPVPGQDCTVAGWGQLRPDSYGRDIDLPEYLNYVKLSVYSNMRCKAYHTRENNYMIDDNMMCAGNSRYDTSGLVKDACMGDSGSPFMCQHGGDDRYVVNGIVSFGYICGNRKTPGIYTKVSSYVDWIYLIMEKYDPEFGIYRI